MIKIADHKHMLNIVKNIFRRGARLAMLSVSLPAIVIVLVFALAVIFTGNIVKKNPEPWGLLKGAEIIQQEEDALVAKVRAIIDLPEEERPTVATVSDVDKLQDQQFFAKAIEGDKLLVYNDSKKAVLYRPSENRVVEVGNLNINEQGEVAGIKNNTPVKIVILNGTQIPGLTNELESSVLNFLPNAEIVSKANATRQDYKESLLVNLSGVDAAAIASSLNLFETDSLPEGELRPDGVDYVLILGQDKAPQIEEEVIEEDQE